MSFNTDDINGIIAYSYLFYLSVFQVSSVHCATSPRKMLCILCSPTCHCCSRAMPRPRPNTSRSSLRCSSTRSRTAATSRRAGNCWATRSSTRPSTATSATSWRCGWASWRSGWPPRRPWPPTPRAPRPAPSTSSRAAGPRTCRTCRRSWPTRTTTRRPLWAARRTGWPTRSTAWPVSNTCQGWTAGSSSPWMDPLTLTTGSWARPPPPQGWAGPSKPPATPPQWSIRTLAIAVLVAAARSYPTTRPSTPPPPARQHSTPHKVRLNFYHLSGSIIFTEF